MRKILCFMIFLILTFSLVGCNENAPSASDSSVATDSVSDTGGASSGEEASKVLENFWDKYEETDRFSFDMISFASGLPASSLRQKEELTISAFVTCLEEDDYVNEVTLEDSIFIYIYFNEDGSTELTEESYSFQSSFSVVHDEHTHGLKPGEAANDYYRIVLPEDCPIGTYHVGIRFCYKYYHIFENAIEVVEESGKIDESNGRLFSIGMVSFKWDGESYKRYSPKAKCRPTDRFMRGEKLSVEALLKYQGTEMMIAVPAQENWTYCLYYNEDGSTELTDASYRLDLQPAVYNTNGKEQVDPGTVLVRYGTCEIPKDCPVGKYHVLIQSDEYTELFENAIEVVE